VVWVSVAQVLVDSDEEDVDSVPQLAVQVGDGGPLVKWVVGLDLSGGQSIEKMPRNLKQGGSGIGGSDGRLGMTISGNVGSGFRTGDQ
jgi:hypothetical protein